MSNRPDIEKLTRAFALAEREIAEARRLRATGKPFYMLDFGSEPEQTIDHEIGADLGEAKP